MQTDIRPTMAIILKINRQWPINIKSIFFISLLVTISCNDKGPTDPDPDPAPVAKISASATSGTAPLVVIFTDESTGQIDSRTWEFHNGQTSSSRQVSFSYTQAGSFSVRLTVRGPGGSDTETTTIRVSAPQPRVTLSDLKYTINNSSQTVTLSVDVNFREFANQSRVLGVYWFRSCDAGFCFQNANCNTNVPGDYLGHLLQLHLSSNNVNFDDMGANFPFSCFPVRTAGTIYYAYAVVYDRIDINAVTDVNNPSLASIGPPNTIVSIIWQ